MLPAVVIVLGVEDALFVFVGGDVLLPLFLAVAVLPTQPAVVPSLRFQANTITLFSFPTPV